MIKPIYSGNQKLYVYGPVYNWEQFGWDGPIYSWRQHSDGRMSYCQIDGKKMSPVEFRRRRAERDAGLKRETIRS